MSSHSTIERRRPRRVTPPVRPVPAPSAHGPRRRSRLSRLLGSSVVQGLLILVALVWITPLAGLFLSSMRSERDLSLIH
ncbi:hypothetical protein VR46_28775, partial [Streptomyces sp. NRRL S-444]